MLNRPRILVANSDRGICRLLRRHFTAFAYVVQSATTGNEALDLIRRSPPDLAILSTDLGDIPGIELIQRVRAVTNVPIIALIRHDGSVAPSAVLDSGADDCVEDPFLLEELAARTRRLLQWSGAWQGPASMETSLGPLETDPRTMTMQIAGRSVRLTRKEFDLLSVLVGARGGTLTHDDIVQKVWGRGYSGARQNLRRTVGSLRHKIEPDPANPVVVLSVRGNGYRLSVRSGAEISASAAVDSPDSETRNR